MALRKRRLPPHLNALSSLILLLAACGGGEEPRTQQMDGVRHTAPPVKQLEVQELLTGKEGLEVLTMPNPNVSLCELNVVEPAFNTRVFRDAAGTQLIERPMYRFTIASLRTQLPPACDDGLGLLMVHYGLTPQHRMTYGLARICAETTEPHAFFDPTDFYTPDGSGNLTRWTGGLGQTWMSEFGDDYKATGAGANVFLKRTADTITAFNPAQDTHYVLFQRSRVQELIDDNPTATHIEIVSYAHLKNANTYHHGVVLLASDASGRMINDGPPTSPYSMRGLNLGSPCPANCNRFAVPTAGEPVPGCP